METFGARLRDAMLIAGVTSEWVAKRRQVRIEVVTGCWLKSARSNCMDAETLCFLGIDLGVSIRWLGVGTGSPVPVGMKKAREELSARVTPRAPRKRRDAVPRE